MNLNFVCDRFSEIQLRVWQIMCAKTLLWELKITLKRGGGARKAVMGSTFLIQIIYLFDFIYICNFFIHACNMHKDFHCSIFETIYCIFSNFEGDCYHLLLDEKTTLDCHMIWVQVYTYTSMQGFIQINLASF